MNWMTLNFAFRVAATFTLASATGCTATQVKRRFEIESIGESEQRKDNLTVRCQAICGDALTSDSRFTAPVNLRHVSRGSQATGSFTPNQFVFNLQIVNGLEHILRFGGHAPAVVRLMTSSGEAVRPMPKDELVVQVEKWLAPQTSPGEWYVLPDSHQIVRDLAGRLNLMNLNSEVLPSATAGFYVAFDIPNCRTPQQVEDWLMSQDTLALRLFDVIVETDPAGNPTRKTTFDFHFRVLRFEDTWEASMFDEPRRVSSRALN